MCPNGLTDLNEFWNQDIFGDDTSFEEKMPFYKIRPGTFNENVTIVMVTKMTMS